MRYLLLLSLLMIACTSHDQIRGLAQPVQRSLATVRSADDELQEQLRKESVEVYQEGFSLGIIELSDDGHVKDENQRRKVFEHLANVLDKDGGILVTFVHGWHHDAAECDSNLACFREVLLGIKNMSDRQNRGPVVGLYVGWRGDSVLFPKVASFYERKRAAHHIGERVGRDLLQQLDDFYRERRAAGKNLTMITAGHSFGGALVYSAIESLRIREYNRTHRMAPPTTGKSREPRFALGDLVLLVNPAFEAYRYTTFAEDITSDAYPYSPEQQPRMLTVSSGRDRAVGLAFPFGRTLWILPRFWRYKNFGQEVLGHGRYSPHVTYDLRGNRKAAKGVLSKDSCACRQVQQAFTSANALQTLSVTNRTETACAQETFGTLTLTPRAGNPCAMNMPFAVIHTNGTVIRSHNDIFNRTFVDFLSEYVRRFLASAPTQEYR